ncbi:guanylate kinase [Candidatus Magnetaquicoccus inordinatus]|uniref:guanylate kinase n=1 Tax=Candidatus Magnetaquicoccus inordinatus TaxID=2496818 RepID=UPI00102BB574
MGRGFIIILSAPSGAGKGTLAAHLLQTMSDLRWSVSTTTRAPRPGEIPGESYHYVDADTFRKRIEQGAFLEWAEVFGNYYGTELANVEPALARGEDLLLDIDWQGARQVRDKMPTREVVSIAILPPSRQALQERLLGRSSDDPQVIARRMAQAGNEIAHWHEYDYLVVNDDLQQACHDLTAIITAERLRRIRERVPVRKILATFAKTM